MESGKERFAKARTRHFVRGRRIHIGAGDEVDVYDHPNQDSYPGQKISVVLIEGYAYLVPFVESEGGIFLKTIIPSRKASKQYSGESDDQT